MGTYRLNRGPHYHILAKRRELYDDGDMDTFENDAAFKAELKANPRPGKLKLCIKHLTQQPSDWEKHLFGDFPTKGLLAVYMRLPSSNKSLLNK